jgi:cytidylate kinase
MSSTPPRRLIVAIDGPAGSGKSTTARAVAEALGYAHLDSGALYRAVTLVALDAGERPPRWAGDALARLARERGVALQRRERGGAWEVTIGGVPAGDALRSETVTRNVSAVSALPEVRDFVNERLRAAARDGGVVLEGRDIGTVVFPDAAVKVFLVAEPAERARRRLLERGRTVERASVEDETQALLARDALDSSRAVAPLARASDAVLLDTTQLGFEEQVRAVVDLARRAENSLDRIGNAG